MRVVLRLFVAALFVASFTSSSFAGPAKELDRNIGRLLAAMPGEGKSTFHGVPLGRESLDTIEIEPMEVWAKDAKILADGPTGEPTQIAPPDVKYFKGRVKGEDESAVFFSRSANGAIRGMVLIGERRWIIGSGVRLDRRVVDVRKEFETGAELVDGNTPLLIREIDDLDDLNNPSSGWKCDVGTHAPDAPFGVSNLRTEAMGAKPATEAGNVPGATYQLRLAIETDNELCAAFDNDTTALNTYIGDLIAEASIIYSRDVSTTLLIGQVNPRCGGPESDPWEVLPASGTGAALAEFGTHWHNNYPQASFPRSTALFLSGKAFFGGIAWVNRLCADDSFCGATGSSCNAGVAEPTYANQWAGGYAFNGSINVITTTVPDSTLTVDGIQYGMPNTADYVMLQEVTHELGHNVGSPHSSCVALSPAEQASYGVAPRGFVDLCLSGETYGGNPCYAGSTSAPAEKGTIMSYCHIMPGAFPPSRYILGKAGEPSEKMFPIFKTGLEGSTPNPTVTVQTAPVSCAAGRTASVAVCAGCTYSWSIDGGTITSSSTISSITYTPAEPEVTLTVTVLAAKGCGITASKTFTSSCVGVLPPANVVATATSTSNVNVSWTASAEATSYNVYRSTGGAYALAGSTAALAFNDGGRSANTAYLYKVHAVNGGESTASNIDVATTVIFTDDPLVAGTTVMKATHITQLRTAVNAVRTLASLGGGTYTDPTVTAGVTAVKAAHINDLRTAIDAARSALTLSALSYGETVTASVTSVKASHLTELRNGVK